LEYILGMVWENIKMINPSDFEMKKKWLIAVFLLVMSIVYAQESLVGDFDNNCRVDFSDFTLFSEEMRKAFDGNRVNLNYDLSGNGFIEIDDFLIFAENFNRECGVSRPVVTSVETSGENCEEILDEGKRNYCWDLQAVRELDASICSNINVASLAEFCEYRVSVFDGSYEGVLRGYHVLVEQSRDMDLKDILRDFNTVEFSNEEYEAISKRDWQVVYNDRSKSFLFVVQAPEGEKFGRINFGDVFRYHNIGLYGGRGKTEEWDINENVFVRVKKWGKDYVSLREYRSGRGNKIGIEKDYVPVIDGEFSFIFHDFGNEVPIFDQAFVDIEFARREGGFGPKLNPSGEFI
jgi:hypothetical protein